MTAHRMMKDYDNSFNKMIVVSLLLHTLLLTIIFSLSSFPSPRLTFGPVYSVDLVSFSKESQSQRALSSMQQAIREIAQSNRVLKDRLDASSVPIKRTDAQKKELSSVEKAIENIRRKMTSADQTSARAEDADSRVSAYYVSIWSRIKGQWALPQGILPKDNMEAVIHVRILKDGTVVDMSFEKHSGNRYFDESVIKAVKKASPFPPLSGWFKESSIELGIRFHPSEFR